jgi:hypothetical protein
MRLIRAVDKSSNPRRRRRERVTRADYGSNATRTRRERATCEPRASPSATSGITALAPRPHRRKHGPATRAGTRQGHQPSAPAARLPEPRASLFHSTPLDSTRLDSTRLDGGEVARHPRGRRVGSPRGTARYSTTLSISSFRLTPRRWSSSARELATRHTAPRRPSSSAPARHTAQHAQHAQHAQQPAQLAPAVATRRSPLHPSTALRPVAAGDIPSR